MPDAPAPLSDADVRALLDALGDAPAVTYAPPNIYPMSAPVFDEGRQVERPSQPKGPLGVYAHVPYCNYKCMFCFYATELKPTHAAMERYVEALIRELSWIEPGTPLAQLYVGGGTPTALPPELLDRLLAAIFARVQPGEAVNTVECSPESITEAHVEVLRKHGIERVSMGVQSEDEDIRQTINRRHSDEDLVAAYELLVGSGLVVNVDLIYGLPGQREADFRHDFQVAAGRGVHSVTTYNLRVNEKTPIGRLLRDEERLDGTRLIRWREAARAVARECGFEPTRWHTFRRAQPETAREAALRFRDVTGRGNQFSAGVSARSRLNDVIYRNEGRSGKYLQAIEAGLSPVSDVRALDAFEKRLRFVTLTLGDGLPLERAAYERSFDTAFDDDFGPAARQLGAAGVIEDDGRVLSLTERGQLVYDLATRAFYPESVRTWMEQRQQLATTSSNLGARKS